MRVLSTTQELMSALSQTVAWAEEIWISTAWAKQFRVEGADVIADHTKPTCHFCERPERVWLGMVEVQPHHRSGDLAHVQGFPVGRFRRGPAGVTFDRPSRPCSSAVARVDEVKLEDGSTIFFSHK